MEIAYLNANLCNTKFSVQMKTSFKLKYCISNLTQYFTLHSTFSNAKTFTIVKFLTPDKAYSILESIYLIVAIDYVGKIKIDKRMLTASDNVSRYQHLI